MLITHKFEMAMDRRGVAPVVNAVQGDKNTRAVEITLTFGNKPWAVPEGVHAMVRFRKPDGTGGVYDTMPDGSAAMTVAGNVVTAMLAPQVLTVPGSVLAQIELTTSQEMLSTFAFKIFVEPDHSVGTMDSQDYINLSGYVSAEVKRILGEYGGSGLPGESGGYYVPSVSNVDEKTMKVSFTPSKDGMAVIEDQYISLPVGPPGKDGKSAYEYAQEGGFEGTEEEFAEKQARGEIFWVHATLNYETGTAVVEESAEEIYAAYKAKMDCRMLAYVTKPRIDYQVLVLQTAEKGTVGDNGTYYSSTFHQTSSYYDKSEETGKWKTYAMLDEVVVRIWDGTIQNSCLRTMLLTDEDKAEMQDSIPTKLPNPHALTINGQSYDGTKAVDIDLNVGNSAEEFVVTFYHNASGEYTADKTFSEVGSALAEGKRVYGAYVGGVISITLNDFLENMEPVFYSFSGQFRRSLNTKTETWTLILNWDNTVEIYVSDLITADDIPTKLPNPNALTIDEQNYDGTKAVDITDTVNGMIERKMMSVKRAGAKGDGVTDDTAAFQQAMSESRTVYVPGGTYKLSDTLVIRENCCLELSQDTILKFTQTSGNCIEMRGSATLRGNHGILWAAYGLTGNVISMDTSLDGEPHNSIPPYVKADPQWKRQRFLYDIHIIKPNTSGFYRTTDGKCNGTAIYMHCDGAASITWMWANILSGIRIAGGFSYGIRAHNVGSPSATSDNAWNHDMRIEAVIEACEIGVSLENCNGAYLDVVVQPMLATNGTAYAKHGFYLYDSRYVDMMRCRVWDWYNQGLTLWEPGGMYQHIALIGNCRGLLLGDYHCTETAQYPIRDRIYTDTPSNFDTMTILQEPANKWFKSIDNVPYFNNGVSNRKLMLATDKFTAEQAEFIHPADGYYEYVPSFRNLAAEAGYTDGQYLGESGAVGTDDSTKTLTGYIPIKTGAKIIRVGGDGITFAEYGCTFAFYDADKKLLGAYPYRRLNENASWGYTVEDEKSAVAYEVTKNTTHGYNGEFMRVSARGKGENLVVTIDEPLDYTAVWHGEPKRLDDSIHAKNDWNAKEGEVGYIANKPFGESDNAILLPKTQFMFDSSMGLFYTPGYIEFVVGKTYTVNWNGVDYTTECVPGVFNGADVAMLGNPVAVGGENNNQPFAIAYLDGTVGAVPLDGSTAVNVGISGYGIIPIPAHYKNEYRFKMTVEVTENGTATYRLVKGNVANAEYVLQSGGELWLDITRIREDGVEMLTILRLQAYGKDLRGFKIPDGFFESFDPNSGCNCLVFGGISYLDDPVIALCPQANGTYRM